MYKLLREYEVVSGCTECDAILRIYFKEISPANGEVPLTKITEFCCPVCGKKNVQRFTCISPIVILKIGPENDEWIWAERETRSYAEVLEMKKPKARTCPAFKEVENEG